MQGKLKFEIGDQIIKWSPIEHTRSSGEVYSETSNTIPYSNGDGYSVTNGQILGEKGIPGEPGNMIVKARATLSLASSGDLPILICLYPETPWNPPYNYLIDLLGVEAEINIL